MRTGGSTGSQNGNNNCSQTENRPGDHQCGHGKILVVGLGPGGSDFLTPRAQAALDEAQVIIGYKTYLGFIKDLLGDKQVIGSGMRKEIDRARQAVQLARQGQVVAVVSSGDPGVYGMAGIILELAADSVPVEVVPGVTAATSAAAVLGAPLAAVGGSRSQLHEAVPLDVKILLRHRGDFAALGQEESDLEAQIEKVHDRTNHGFFQA